MKNKDIKRIAKLVNEYVDQELVLSRRLFEASPTEDEQAAATKASAAALGGETTGIVHEPLSQASKYEEPSVNSELDIILDDAYGHNIVNHRILKDALFQSYFTYTDEKMTDLKPSPLLIWGAPGIGKSEGVKQGAIRSAREIGKQKGFGDSNFIILDNPDKSDWATLVNKPTDNYYFIDWAAAPEEIKNKISYGTKQHRAIEGGRIRTYFEGKMRIPTSNIFIFVDIRVAGIDAKDLLGIPFRVDRVVTDPKSGEEMEIPSLTVDRLPVLKLLCDARDIHGIIMWDEINQGNNQIQAAMYSVILDRQIGEAKLAPGVGQFAAANNSKIWGGNPLRSALANRFASHYLYLSPEEWVTTFEKTLMPVVKNFIVNNPTISFFITKAGWKEEYLPMLRGRGHEPGDDLEARKSYMTAESGPKWPSPRMLLDFNKNAKQLFEKAKTGHWNEGELIDAIELEARGKLGPIWAVRFRDYYVRTTQVDWDVLVNSPEKTASLINNITKREIIKSLIVDKMKEVYNLKGSIKHAEYKKKLSDLMRVLVNASAREIEVAISTTTKARKDLELSNSDLTKEQVAEKMLDMIEQGTTILPDPKWQSDASGLFERIVAAVTQQVPEIKIKKKATKFETPQPQQAPTTFKTTQPTPDTVDNKDTLPEKFNRFNKLFEELDSTLSQNVSSEPVQQPQQGSTEKRMAAIKNIILRVNKRLDQLEPSLSSGIKAFNDQSKDAIYQIILSDTTLEKEQKQKLISLIKTAPDSVNAQLMLKAFSTKTFNL